MIETSKFTPLSTRLFPKGQGANNYIMSGLAQKCDWCILSDHRDPFIELRKKERSSSPKHIFLSLRNPFEAINHFAEQILPEITGSFILISGSEDVTIPNQLDHRWRKFDEREKANLEKILNHPKLVHWFAENLDHDMGEKVTPIPLGMISPKTHDALVDVPTWPKYETRPPTVLCAHRIRNGEQWEPRRQVTELAKMHWQDWCTVQEDELSEEAYFNLAQQHGFVICVQGGGIDPSPKAWQSLQHGLIPIIETSGVDAAYKELPCVIVNAWTPDCISQDKLKQWAIELAPKFDGPAAKEKLIAALSLDYWWDKVS